MTANTLTINIAINLDTGEPLVEVQTSSVRPSTSTPGSLAARLEAAQAESVNEVKPKILEVVTGVVGKERWCGEERRDPTKPATTSEIKRYLSKKHRPHVDAALAALVDEGTLAAVADGSVTRYQTTH